MNLGMTYRSVGYEAEEELRQLRFISLLEQKLQQCKKMVRRGGGRMRGDGDAGGSKRGG